MYLSLCFYLSELVSMAVNSPMPVRKLFCVQGHHGRGSQVHFCPNCDGFMDSVNLIPHIVHQASAEFWNLVCRSSSDAMTVH